MPNSLLDHTPIPLQFPSSPKPIAIFQYCEMWSKHPDFDNIITSQLHIKCNSPMQALCRYVDLVRPLLRKLNRENYSNLKDQQVKARLDFEQKQKKAQKHVGDTFREQQENEARERYVSILSSSMDFIKQQCKLKWIKYGDDCTRLFFAKAK